MSNNTSGRQRGHHTDHNYSLRTPNSTRVYVEDEHALDEIDEGSYVPRPRLRDPYVQMVTLADLIGWIALLPTMNQTDSLGRKIEEEYH
jgi:hypothetical protein